MECRSADLGRCNGDKRADGFVGKRGNTYRLVWKNYRYRLYSTVVPLHNITWMGQVSGC